VDISAAKFCASWWTSANRSHELKQKTLTKLLELGGILGRLHRPDFLGTLPKAPMLSIVFDEPQQKQGICSIATCPVTAHGIRCWLDEHQVLTRGHQAGDDLHESIGPGHPALGQGTALRPLRSKRPLVAQQLAQGSLQSAFLFFGCGRMIIIRIVILAKDWASYRLWWEIQTKLFRNGLCKYQPRYVGSGVIVCPMGWSAGLAGLRFTHVPQVEVNGGKTPT
jgi:hypothetical protein